MLARRAAWLVAILGAPATAHADIMPDGAKGVTMHLLAEGRVPPGKQLKLANTWDRDLRINPGVLAGPIQWHPFDGALQLELVDEESRDRVKCGEPLTGYRAIRGTSPAADVRFVMAVKVRGDACEATLRTEFRDAKGTIVEPGNLAIDDLPLIAPEEPGSEERDLLSVEEAKQGGAPAEVKAMPTPHQLIQQTTPAALQARGCACAADRRGSPAWTGWLIALALVRRRRRG
jgi:MYXO-CTERM domain-containing protein